MQNIIFLGHFGRVKMTMAINAWFGGADFCSCKVSWFWTIWLCQITTLLLVRGKLQTKSLKIPCAFLVWLADFSDIKMGRNIRAEWARMKFILTSILSAIPVVGVVVLLLYARGLIPKNLLRKGALGRLKGY